MENDLKIRVERVLNSLGLPFVKSPAVMGLYPDFLVGIGEKGYALVLVKDKEGSMKTAMARAAHSGLALEAVKCLLVSDEAQPDDIPDGVEVVGLHQLPLAIAQL